MAGENRKKQQYQSTHHHYNKVVIVTSLTLTLIVAYFLFIPTLCACISEEHNTDVAIIELEFIGETLERFHLTTGHYPSNEEGIDVLVKKRVNTQGDEYDFLPYLPKDPWDNYYIYSRSANNELTTKPYLLYSIGLNGINENGFCDDIVLAK